MGGVAILDSVEDGQIPLPHVVERLDDVGLH
jgi:hypothetical protein